MSNYIASSKRTCDGLQATHVAAQYGHTDFLYCIVTKWNADPDFPDKDGRSSLHWYFISSLVIHLLLLGGVPFTFMFHIL